MRQKQLEIETDVTHTAKNFCTAHGSNTVFAVNDTQRVTDSVVIP